MGRRSRSWPWPRRSSGSPATTWSRPSTGRAWPRPRRRRAFDATCSSAPGPPFRPPARGRSPMRPASWRLVDPVHAVPGDPANIKVTVPEDLGRTAAALLGTGPAAPAGRPSGSASVRRATRSGPAVRSPWAGSRSPAAPACTVTRTATSPSMRIADALLGACGLGDLGRLFPAGPETPARRGQQALLGTVLERVRAAGYRADLAGPDDRCGPAAPRRAPRRDAPAPSPSCSGWRRSGSTSRPRAATSRAGRAPGRGISATAVAVVEPGLSVHRGSAVINLLDTLTGQKRELVPSSPATSGSTPAARRSTDRPTSATSARSCSPTCSSATCATAGCASPGS